MRQNIKLIEKTELRPEMPAQWYKNPIEWLSNYDIDDVMVQYNNEKKYCYSFLGVFPIDFSEEDKFGRCVSCGEKIPLGRIIIMPGAIRCVTCS